MTEEIIQSIVTFSECSLSNTPIADPVDSLSSLLLVKFLCATLYRMDQHTGIEPAFSDWKSDVLPLHQCRIFRAWDGRGTRPSHALPVFPGCQNNPYERRQAGGSCTRCLRMAPCFPWVRELVPQNLQPVFPDRSAEISNLSGERRRLCRWSLFFMKGDCTRTVAEVQATAWRENAELNRSTRALCSLPAHLLLPCGVRVHAFLFTRFPSGGFGF